MRYEPQTFTIPELKGISQTTIDEHIKLYEGYVKNLNTILEALEKGDQSDYALSEMQRRISFEFDGMRNHEVYFGSLEGGAADISDGDLKKKIEDTWNSFDAWETAFKTLAKTRGIGWAILYHDTEKDQLLHTWADEQHLGHLTGCTPILALDMWEHSFVADYQPSGKGEYIDDFFANLNWEFVEKRFAAATK